MTSRQQWSLVAGLATTAVFGVVLALKLKPQLDLIEVGSTAPGFHATDLRTGRPATLADYRGKVVLVNIWATWCPPCRVEMPSMERLQRKLAGTDFRIVAVSVDKEVGPNEVLAFANGLGLSFDLLHDPAGTIQETYQTTGVPESFIIDRDGVIVKKVIGPVEWDGPVHETLIRRLLDAR
ncbi:MAG TPA: TlpA disulfide reductase family protein [Gemmatimonadales bacterium]|jgi:peroxiredoxin|nr:TlpA disulfide reductase family protein [Gemmatimonadales bacterium]